MKKNIIISVVVAAGLITAAILGFKMYRADLVKNGGQQACTEEAKLCSDGSAVGRSGPNCEFAACPAGNGEIESGTSAGEISCPGKNKDAQFCAQIYDPVCATVEIQCIKAPCYPIQQTFGNACEACLNSLVKKYISGECKNDGASAN